MHQGVNNCVEFFSIPGLGGMKRLTDSSQKGDRLLLSLPVFLPAHCLAVLPFTWPMAAGMSH